MIDNQEIINECLKIIKESTVSVPGVVGFANYKSNKLNEMQTDDVSKAVEVFSEEKINKFIIHIILMPGVVVKDILSELQIRISNAFYNLGNYSKTFIVNVIAEKLVVL